MKKICFIFSVLIVLSLTLVSCNYDDGYARNGLNRINDNTNNNGNRSNGNGYNSGYSNLGNANNNNPNNRTNGTSTSGVSGNGNNYNNQKNNGINTSNGNNGSNSITGMWNYNGKTYDYRTDGNIYENGRKTWRYETTNNGSVRVYDGKNGKAYNDYAYNVNGNNMTYNGNAYTR